MIGKIKGLTMILKTAINPFVETPVMKDVAHQNDIGFGQCVGEEIFRDKSQARRQTLPKDVFLEYGDRPQPNRIRFEECGSDSGFHGGLKA